MSPKVTPLGDKLWRVEWEESGRRIDNVFSHDGPPEVTVTNNSSGDTILRLKSRFPWRRGDEVGRYNKSWAGAEVPCEQGDQPEPVPYDEWDDG